MLWIFAIVFAILLIIGIEKTYKNGKETIRTRDWRGALIRGGIAAAALAIGAAFILAG